MTLTPKWELAREKAMIRKLLFYSQSVRRRETRSFLMQNQDKKETTVGKSQQTNGFFKFCS